VSRLAQALGGREWGRAAKLHREEMAFRMDLSPRSPDPFDGQADPKVGAGRPGRENRRGWRQRLCLGLRGEESSDVRVLSESCVIEITAQKSVRCAQKRMHFTVCDALKPVFAHTG